VDINGPGNAGESNDGNDQYSFREDFRKKSHKVTFWVEVAGLFVIFAYTTIAAFQLRATLQVMRAEQRAWINVQTSSTQLEIGKPIVYPLIFGNTGKTPARNVNGVFIMEVLNSADEPSFDYSSPLLKSTLTDHALFPNSPTTILGLTPLHQIPGTKTVEPIELTQDLLDKFNNGQIWFAAEGKISYEDIFGVKHWMNICHAMFHAGSANFVGLPPVGTQRCVEYNDVDKN